MRERKSNMFKKKQTKSTTDGLEKTFEENTSEPITLEVVPTVESLVGFLPKQIELGNIYKAMIDKQPYNIGNYALAKIQERILEWNLQRGHLSYNVSVEIDNYKEEIEQGVLAKDLFDEALLDDEKC